MPNKHKLSLTAAILINTNITMGSGIFINTVVLSQIAGALSGLTYAIIGLLLLPLLLAITQLLKRYPTGGFYAFGSKGLGSYAGFISTWAYYFGKLASGTLAIHVAMSLLQTIFPALQVISVFLLDGIIIGCYTLLNMLNIREGSRIQTGFMIMKMMPIIFVLITGTFLFQGAHLSTPHLLFNGLPSSIPLALFAFYGFESACAISKSLKRPERAYLAILFSYILAVTVTILYQSLFYASLGSTLAWQANYLGAFPALIARLGLSAVWTSKLIGIFHIAIASSALGAAYGIIYSNAWNLHTLAHHNHTFFAPLLTSYNKNRIPYLCVLIEALTCVAYLIVTRGNQIPLQLLAVLGLTVNYTIGVSSLLATAIQEKTSKILPVLALVVCVVLFSMLIRNFFLFGINPLIAFLLLMAFGTFMYLQTPGSKEPEEEIIEDEDDDVWKKYY